MSTSTYITGPFSFIYVPPNIANMTISGLSSRRGIEGPQIILNWIKPLLYGSLIKIRLVRKMGSYPADETDGKILLDSTDTEVETFTDFPDYAPEFYYYKVFSLFGAWWISTRLTEIVELALDTKSEKQDKFYNELPEIYRALDKLRAGSRQQALSPVDLDSEEKILLAEDGETQQGEFRRFLKIMNIFFNEALSRIRALATRDGLGPIFDIDRTSPQYLDYMAKLYGWKFDFELPVVNSRAEIKRLPDLYKKKGRRDITEDMINDILMGHTVTIITPDEVLDLNGYPQCTLIDTTDIVRNVNFLTALSDIFVFCDITAESSIGFNQIAINIAANILLKITSSQMLKLEDIVGDFFCILDTVFLIVHQTIDLNYPADFTTAGVALIGSGPFPFPTLPDYFEEFALGSGDDDWDYYSAPPSESPTDTALQNEVFRDVPRNVVYLDGSDNPTTTPTNKLLVRCFMDLETFTNLYNREAGLFENTLSAGTLLCEKFFPIRYINGQVRYIVDFKIQFP